ncbi:unnamed protein product [Strongylus vulgaris]|uniref:Uncharacterized protein n=1 Tax=Strongylus vulgaris TaxID=40348 RepID=A0A3P7JJC9_STRVU|nr:unnamed protein product [Strongylus vulgaris]
MFWAFVIPCWILIAVTGLQAQLSCLACDKTTPEQDQVQCFWAKKSAKSLLLLSLLLFTLWFMILSAGNEQIFYLFILATLIAILTGPGPDQIPMFQTCQKWSTRGCFGCFYKLCPEKPKEKPKAEPKDPLDDDDDELAPQEPAPTTQPAPQPEKVAPPEKSHDPAIKEEKVLVPPHHYMEGGLSEHRVEDCNPFTHRVKLIGRSIIEYWVSVDCRYKSVGQTS